MSVDKEATSLSPALVKKVFAAVRNNHADQIKVYTDMGGDLNLRDHDGWTMLMHTIPHNQPEMARLILALGANPEMEDLDDGATPLHKAASRGVTEIVSALLEAGANPDAPNKSGITPLMAAVQEHRHDVVERLLEGGADVNRCDPSGAAALYLCARYGLIETLELLLEWGADPNFSTRTGLSPLIAASWVGDIEKTEALLAAGAEKDHKDDKGRTAESIARDRRFTDLERLLG